MLNESHVVQHDSLSEQGSQGMDGKEISSIEEIYCRAINIGIDSNNLAAFFVLVQRLSHKGDEVWPL